MGAYRMVPLLAILPALVIECGRRSRQLEALLGFSADDRLRAVRQAPRSRAWAWRWRLFFAGGSSRGRDGDSLRPGRSGKARDDDVIAGGRESDDLVMASPFFWAGELTFEASNRGHDCSVGWAIFWTVICAWIAVELLGFTLAQFDRRLGRIENPVARLATRPGGSEC